MNTKRKLSLGIIKGSIKYAEKETPGEGWTGWVWAEDLGWTEGKYNGEFIDLYGLELNVIYWILE